MRIGVCVSHEIPRYKWKFLNSKNKENNISKDWSEKFIQALKNEDMDYGLIYIDRENWIDSVKNYDLLIWKPNFMGIQSSQFFKEKVYFIQHIMKKRIYPNYETVWHFDSKVAQKYLFDFQKINTPSTFVSFNYNECIDKSKRIQYPVVLKSSNGAGSKGVKLVKSQRSLQKEIYKSFIFKKIKNKLIKTKNDPFGYIYFQEFIKGNTGDLRINIIGDKYAVGFWRQNRENDFRASGSGLIDYRKNIPEQVIKYCAAINKKNRFDSMAYDILFNDEGFLIIEMSYGYIDSAIYNAKGYYLLNENGEVEDFIEGNYWPQELWIKWVLSESNHS